MPKIVALDQVWPTLSAGARQLLEDITQPISAEEYLAWKTSVMDFCTASSGNMTGSGARFRGSELYAELGKLLEARMEVLLEMTTGVMGVTLLSMYADMWRDYQTALRIINNMFDYMNRYWLKRQREEAQLAVVDVFTIKELCVKVWRDQFFVFVSERLVVALLAEVERERNGEQIDSTLVQTVTGSFAAMAFDTTDPEAVVLTVYQEKFEDAFIEATRVYYVVESSKFLTDNSCADYMKKVQIRLAEEVDRVARYLHPTTEVRLTSTCEEVMIQMHMDKIQDEFPSMLTQDKQDDLRRLYNLLSRIENGLTPLRTIFREHVRDDGLAQIEALKSDDDGDGDDDDAAGASSSKAKDKDKAKPKKKRQEFKAYVECLIRIHDRYWQLIVNVFAEDNGFVGEMNKAFDYFMNLENNRSPEYLSLYIDDKLKKGAKGVTEEEKTELVDKCLVLFRRLEEKDMFERYYKNHLAKRLLNGRSASNDAEREVITKLKAECGVSFTHKLEGMFKDVQLSADIMDAFRDSDLGKRLDIDLSVQVLTTGFWPQDQSQCNLPPEINRCQEAFRQFYLNSHSGRVLNWQSTQGTAELKASFAGQAREFSCSTTQMAILCLFNQAETMSFAEIKDATGLDQLTLKRDLLALACAKYKILAKVPKTRKIKADDVFSFNDAFKCKLFKFKIAQVITKETSKEREDTMRKVDDDRKFKIDAAIVRIMKARKSLDHANLVAEVIKQLRARFNPSPQAIKKSIGGLIERSYLERDPKARNVYLYLA